MHYHQRKYFVFMIFVRYYLGEPRDVAVTTHLAGNLLVLIISNSDRWWTSIRLCQLLTDYIVSGFNVISYAIQTLTLRT